MNDFFSIIGSVASLISIPLAIFLYLKSKEAKFDKLKKEISRILSYQIGDERQLSTFEIKTVISSKLRENRINTDSISVSEIVEDLVSETISSPLITKERKSQILENLKKIYIKGELFDELDAITNTTNKQEITWENIEPRFKELMQDNIKMEEKNFEQKQKHENDAQRMSTVFALTALLITILTLIFKLVGKNKFEEWNDSFTAPFKGNEFLMTITLGSLTSMLAGILTAIFRNRKRKK